LDSTASFDKIFSAAEKRTISIVNEMTKNNTLLDQSTVKTLNDFFPSGLMNGLFNETVQTAINNNEKLKTVTQAIKFPNQQEVKEAARNGQAHILMFNTLIQIGAIPSSLTKKIENAEKFIKENIAHLDLVQLGELKGLLLENTHGNGALSYLRNNSQSATMYGGSNSYKTIVTNLDSAIREKGQELQKRPH
jgi:hypothetical protein